jgi:tetratricopeptide (TPR) repeat protein
MSRHLFASLLLLFGVPSAFAQLQSIDVGNLKIRVTTTDGRGCDSQLHLELMGGSSNASSAETYTNESGMAEFIGLRVGDYHVVVSGGGIETTDSGVFEVDARKSTQIVYIPVKRTGEAEASAQKPHGGPSIAAVDLNIPDGARKEFDKASDFIAKENWKKAVERLKKALELYPKYASAYNNMGIAYGHLGDRKGEREALQQAVGLNDKFAAAYANLAKMDITDRNFPDAESMLNRAVSADPANSQSVLLLANVELLNRHYEEAIANSRKLHSMSNDPHALAHYIAARAFEHQNRTDDAYTEFQTFLKEEATGPRADAVRKEMSGLQTHPLSAAVPADGVP